MLKMSNSRNKRTNTHAAEGTGEVVTWEWEDGGLDSRSPPPPGLGLGAEQGGGSSEPGPAGGGPQELAGAAVAETAPRGSALRASRRNAVEAGGRGLGGV